MTDLTAARAAELLSAFAGARPLIVGDLMLDEYLFGDVERISPEAPVPVVHLKSESYRLGGAGNVAANAAALGAIPRVVGLLGRDGAADRFLTELGNRGIDGAGVVHSDLRPTTTKTRIVAHSQQVVRCDREQAGALTDLEIDQVLGSCLAALDGADVVILSDYAKGCLHPRILKDLLGAAAERQVPVIVDPAVAAIDRYQPVTAITPNHHEAALATQVFGPPHETIEQIGRRLLQRLDCRYVLVTRGEAGMSLFERDVATIHIPTVAREVFDVTGAGDTVATTFSLAMACGASPVEAAVLSNHAAGLVVKKVGVAVATPAELLASF